MTDAAGRVYLGAILLEENRWPDRPATHFSRGEKLCRGRAAQDEYTRLCPGFAAAYPLEVNAATLRRLVA